MSYLCNHYTQRCCLLLLSLFLLSAGVLADTVVLPPIDGAAGPDVAMIFINGAQIAPQLYVPMAQAVQKYATGMKLWIAMPSFLGDLPVLGLDLAINGIKTQLANQGFPDCGKYFLSGHSLGSAIIQAHAMSNPDEYLAVVLMSGPINRKYRTPTSSLPMPTLTITGEVDGLVRLSRVAESLRTQVLKPAAADWPKKYPVVVIPGINHLSFGSGNPPKAIKDRDLKLEISFDDAHDLIGQHVGAYFQTIMTGKMPSVLVNAISYTNDLLQPLVKSLELEGFTHFQDFCPEGSCDDSCYCGSPWVAQFAQSIMAGIGSRSTFQVQYAPSQSPQVIDATCTGSSNCNVTVRTSSSNSYPLGDFLDTGFTQTAATEIVAKLVSRAEIQRHTTNSNADESSLDNVQSICAEINKAAYHWGLQNAGAKALDRFHSLGEPFSFGSDTSPLNVPLGRESLWSNTAVSFSDVTGDDGVTTSQVVSSGLISSGTHYCKLLSPARVMEWIYTDGLHYHDGI